MFMNGETFEQRAKWVAEHCGCEAADTEAIVLRELREAYRLGLKEGKPQPWTKNHCDLCQEPMEGRGPWHWVEEGWSLACDRCWRLIEAAMKRCS